MTAIIAIPVCLFLSFPVKPHIQRFGPVLRHRGHGDRFEAPVFLRLVGLCGRIAGSPAVPAVYPGKLRHRVAAAWRKWAWEGWRKCGP